MSHSYCKGCNGVILCPVNCKHSKQILKPSDKAVAQSFFEYCDECFDKLPTGTRSHYQNELIVSIEREQRKLDSALAQIENAKRVVEASRYMLQLLRKDKAVYGTEGKQ